MTELICEKCSRMNDTWPDHVPVCRDCGAFMYPKQAAACKGLVKYTIPPPTPEDLERNLADCYEYNMQFVDCVYSQMKGEAKVKCSLIRRCFAAEHAKKGNSNV